MICSEEERKAQKAELLRLDLNLITEEQLAGAIGVTTQTLTEWRCKKQGPTYVKLGRTVFYDINDIKTWCQHKRVIVIDEHCDA